MGVIEETVNSNKFEYHKEFINDIKFLLAKDLNGNKQQFIKLCRKQVSNLNNFSSNHIVMIDSNELLKYQDDFVCYSLHLRSKGFNVRFLVSLKNDKYILLVAFNEKSKRSNYSRYIDIAKKRYMEDSKYEKE